MERSRLRGDLRRARGDGDLAWITSHTFRKTAATILDEAALSARLIADQLGHARPSMTQDVYLTRRAVDDRAAQALDEALRGALRPERADGKEGGYEHEGMYVKELMFPRCLEDK